MALTVLNYNFLLDRKLWTLPTKFLKLLKFFTILTTMLPITKFKEYALEKGVLHNTYVYNVHQSCKTKIILIESNIFLFHFAKTKSLLFCIYQCYFLDLPLFAKMLPLVRRLLKR